jgi:hypothetical protein
MDLNKEKAQKADRAASAIGDALVKTLTDLRPDFATEYELDDQLVTLAIAKAAVGIAADATSQATGMGDVASNDLEDRLHAVVFDAMNEMLKGKDAQENS